MTDEREAAPETLPFVEEAALPELALTENLGQTESTEALPPPEAGMRALESTALNATLWTVLSYGAGQGLRLVNSFLLTHLLLPAAFGEMTLVATLLTGITMLSDLGLAPSVIQSKRGDDPSFLNTTWTLQVLRATGICLLGAALAWPAARFYHDPRMFGLLCALALGSLISGFNSTSIYTQQKHMGVRRLFLLDFSTQILALVVTVGWALYRPTVWALVVGNLVSTAFKLILSHTPAVPGVRCRFRLERAALGEIVRFGKWIILGTAFLFCALQSDRLILGKLVSFTVLGLYGLAYQISDVPRSILSALSNKVGYPFVSKISHLPMAEFRKQLLRYRRYALLIGAVLLSAMVVWGHLIILKLYPAKYADAAPMVPILAIGLWHTLLYTTMQPVLFSLGKSTYNAVGNALYAVAILCGIPLGFHYYGLTGAVVAVAAGDLPLYIVTQFGATRERVRPLWQDCQMTAVFAGLLGVEFLLRSLL